MSERPASLPSSLVLVGAGKMGGAMLEGWVRVGLDPSAITVIDPHLSATMRDLCVERGIRLGIGAGPTSPDVVVLAVKPQALDDAAPTLAPLVGPGTLVISVLAGKTIANLRDRLGVPAAVVRAMPNLPASIGRGATGAVASPETTGPQRQTAHALLASIGSVEWVGSEDLIDAVTALSGSGPAYLFHLAECLARAGVAAGLPADLAARLARATIAGSGEMLARSDLGADALRANVTSPGGTTAAALDVLMRPGGLEALVTEAVLAAKRRAAELSG